MLKKPDETLMCSPGHHVVHAHIRTPNETKVYFGQLK